MASKNMSNIITGLLRGIRRYVRRGMLVSHVYVNGDYDKENIRSTVKPAILHIHAPDEHARVAENEIKTVKERTRAHMHSLPYK